MSERKEEEVKERGKKRNKNESQGETISVKIWKMALPFDFDAELVT